MDDSAYLSASPHVTEQCDNLPFASETVLLSKLEYIELKSQCNFYKTQHERALVREAELKQQLAQEQAKVRDLNLRLYGKKSEQSRHRETLSNSNEQAETPTRSRGQQPGSRGHGRTLRPHLPVTEEIRDLAEHEKYCVDCGLPHRDLGTTEDSEIIEIQVAPYLRKIRRRKYRGCGCQGEKRIVTASPAPRVLPRSMLGVSVWVEILLDKYLSAQATHRLLNDFAHLGCPLSTVTGGLQRLAPLFEPLVDALRDKQRSERLFHADETGWKVFEEIENKASNRWYLWVTQSPSVVHYQMAPGRDAGVPLDHFSELAAGQFPVFLVCDRYSAYKIVTSGEQFVALLGFGASAWQAAPRDNYIGWSHDQRKAQLHRVVNNARFLILPWVKSKNLASMILSMAARRLPADWESRYHYRPVLLETFVEKNRFAGTSYKAANWIHVGETKGRGKLGPAGKQSVPIKDMWLYPLARDFRSTLTR